MKIPTSPGTWTASLRTHLVVLILIATVPIAGLMSYQIVRDMKIQQQRLMEDLSVSAAAVSQSVGRELESTVDALTILAHAAPLQEGNLKAFEKYLLLRHQLRTSWRSIYLVDRDGHVLFDSQSSRQEGPSSSPEALAMRPPVERGDTTVSNLLNSSGEGPYATAIEVPVIHNRVPRYTLGVWIDATHWQSLAMRAAVPRDGLITLYDRNKRVIARTQSPEPFVGQMLPQQTAADRGNSPAGTHRTALLEGGDMYAAWQTVPSSGWGVDVGVPAEPIDALRGNTVLAALGTTAACLLAGVALALLAARGVTRPLHQLAGLGRGGDTGPVRVHEVALLRDALLEAQAQETAARARVQAKAKEFETLFTGSPIGKAFAQDAQCRHVLHNETMIAMVGTPSTPGEAPGYQMRYQGRLLPPEEQPLQRAATTGLPSPPVEVELLVPGRPVRYVIAQAAPLLDARQQPCGAIAAMTDITERKSAEAKLQSVDQQLRDSQRLVDLAQQAGYVGFFHYAVATVSATWTPGQLKLFGFDETPFGGTLDEWAQRIHPPDREAVQSRLVDMLQMGHSKDDLEYRVVLPNQPLRWLSTRVLVNYSERGAPHEIVGVTFDITERKQIETRAAELSAREQAARVEAEQANSAKDEFMAMLGHELRNPLSAISSAVEVLERTGHDSALAARARGVIGRQTRHLSHLMDDLMDVGRVISGKVTLSHQSVDLAALVQRQLTTLEFTGEARGHDVSTRLSTAWVHADVTRLEQVANNLLSNAFKYTPKGGSVDIRVDAIDGHAVLEVQDNGPGIPADLQPRIFELFVQGERPLDRRVGGLGIGLTLVRRLVELHDGSVTVASSPRGSTFTVRLPRVQAPAAVAAEHKPQPAHGLRVLLIEDNEDALSSLRTLLEQEGHDVLAQRDGNGGLASLLHWNPDVAIVDIGLPGMTGYELARASRRAGYTGQLIALSGYGLPKDKQEARRSGFDEHMVKPVDAGALREMMAQH